MRYRSSSPETTHKIATDIAARLKKLPHRKHARVIALRGDLGSGKTTFTQSFLGAFGVRGRVTSPTFVLMQRYVLRDRWFRTAYHIDGYRLRTAADFKAIGLRDMIADPRAIILIEWPARARTLLPAKTISISLAHGRSEFERVITVRM